MACPIARCTVTTSHPLAISPLVVQTLPSEVMLNRLRPDGLPVRRSMPAESKKPPENLESD